MVKYTDCTCVPLLQKNRSPASNTLEDTFYWKKKSKKQNNISSESHYNTFKYKLYLCHLYGLEEYSDLSEHFFISITQ